MRSALSKLLALPLAFTFLHCAAAPDASPDEAIGASAAALPVRGSGGGGGTSGGGGGKGGGGNTPQVNCYFDNDRDGHIGTTLYLVSATSCTAPYSATPGDDCNDFDASIFPRACDADYDGDNYKSSHTMCVASCPGLPSSIDGSGNDCDDGNAAVHPFRHEVTSNGVDDDCDGFRDEAEFNYSTVTTNDASSLYIAFDLYDAALIHAQPLYARITYERLNFSQAPQQQWQQVILHTTPSGGTAGVVVLDGLYSSTVYRLWLDFSSSPNGSHYPQSGSDWADGARSTDVFYAMTNPAPGEDAVTTIRTPLVNLAFQQWAYEQHGDIHQGYAYCGDCDARLGPGHYWCSEFYNWVTNHWLEDMFVRWGSDQVTTSSIIDAFANHGGQYWTGNVPADLTGSARPGDYIPMAVPGQAASHSMMFLGWDGSTGRYWWIAGNDNNTIAIGNSDPRDTSFAPIGVGHLTPGMLK